MDSELNLQPTEEEPPTNISSVFNGFNSNGLSLFDPSEIV